jgi:hypothetical protein
MKACVNPNQDVAAFGHIYLEAPLFLVRLGADLHLRLLVHRQQRLILTVVCIT